MSLVGIVVSNSMRHEQGSEFDPKHRQGFFPEKTHIKEASLMTMIFNRNAIYN